MSTAAFGHPDGDAALRVREELLQMIQHGAKAASKRLRRAMLTLGKGKPCSHSHGNAIRRAACHIERKASERREHMRM